MRDELSSTAHYEAVIADYRAELGAVERQALDLRELIAKLEAKAKAIRQVTVDVRPKSVIVAATPPIVKVEPSAVPSDLSSLGLGDACIAAITTLGGRATNHEIVQYLQSRKYNIRSDKPLNNVGTGLNHRSKRPNADIAREGRYWVLKKSESPAPNAASQMNGAAASAS